MIDGHSDFGREGDLQKARQFVLVGVLALILAGVLALSLVAGRVPWLGRWLPAPLFFKRALVVHVVLALGVWQHAFSAGLGSLLPRRLPPRQNPFAPGLMLGGVLALIVCAALPGAVPLLSNYLPLLDHPLFLFGLGSIALALVLPVLDGGTLTSNGALEGSLLPSAVQVGLRANRVLVFCAVAAFIAGALTTPAFLEPQQYYENLFWGGGHLLQSASTAAMLSCWLLLLSRALGREVLSPGVSRLLFAALTLPALLSLMLFREGTTSGTYREGFTLLMRWSLFPSVLTAIALLGRAILREARVRKALIVDGRVLGFFSSAGLALLGIALGALIRGSTTMVPAHYHASIGAVTGAFMAATFALWGELRFRPLSSRLSRLQALQPLLFGVGQAVFAAGFALAGAHGMGRKQYGAEQTVRTVAQSTGLGVMAAGGLLAVAGGLLFIFLVIRGWPKAARAQHGGSTWTTYKSRSIPSRG